MQYRVACALKVVLCSDGAAATEDMFGAEHKDENGTPISFLKKTEITPADYMARLKVASLSV
jgi:hypothetical protein